MQTRLLLLLCLSTVFRSVLLAQDPAYPPAPAAPLQVMRAEYFVDTDPGVGNGTDIPLTAGVDISNIPVAVNTASLIAGVHRIYIRTRNAEGAWSIVTVRSFVVDFDPAYTSAPAAPFNVTEAEYFVDTDPGYGSGTPISLTAGLDIANIPVPVATGSLIAGVHRVYIRTRNAEGEWSVVSVRSFIVDFDPPYPVTPAAPLAVSQAESFINTDPGIGSGSPISLTPGVNISNLSADVVTASLPQGPHRLYIRTRNTEGEWSITSLKSFVVTEDPLYPSAPASPGNITRVEYFFDTDPGFGNGTPVSITPAVNITDLTFAATTSSLTAGTHYLYIRSLDDWSLTSFREVEVLAPAPKVVLSGALTGNFQTLRDAFAAINTGGGSGSVIATVVDNTLETQQAVLNQTNYVVTVVPDGNRTVEGNLTTPLILLNASDQVTVDGLSFAGSNRLTIRNTNTGSGANAIRISGNASNNTIKRCTLEGSGSGNTASTAIVVINTDNSGNADNNVIDSNYIRPATASGASNGILVGTLLTSNTGRINQAVIQHNRIENVFVNHAASNNGILSLSNVNNLTVRGNSVYNTAAFSNNTNGAFYYGIRASNASGGSGSGVLIDSNFVGGTQPLAAGTKMSILSPSNSATFIGIQLFDNTANSSSITRNVVRNLDMDIANPTTSAINPFLGIWCAGGTVQEYNQNVVGDSLTANSVTLFMRPASTGGVNSFGQLMQVPVAGGIVNNTTDGFLISTAPISGSTVVPGFTLLSVTGPLVNQVVRKNRMGTPTGGIQINSATSGSFSLRGISVSYTTSSPTITLDSNRVRNIAVNNNADFLGMAFFNNVSSSTPHVEIRDNLVSGLRNAGTGGAISALIYITNGTTSGSQATVDIRNNLLTNLSNTGGSNLGIVGLRINTLAGTVNRMKGFVRDNVISELNNFSSGSGGASRGIAVAHDVVLNDSLVIASNQVTGVQSANTFVTTNSVGCANGMSYASVNTGTNGLAVIRDNVVQAILSTATDNLALTSFGISLFGNNLLTERNRVFNLANAAASPNARTIGLYARSRNDDASVGVIRNNMIALNTTTSGRLIGVELGDGAVNAKLYHNSILVEGAVSANSYALFKTATAVADVKNTILYNAATGAGTAYAVGLETSVAGYSSNNNYFVSPVAASLAEINGTAQSLAAWRTATSQDAATEEGASGVNTNAANLFTGKTTAQLLVNTLSQTEPLKVSDKGMAHPDVLTDFLGSPRSATTPDIGAHEFLFSPPLPLTLLSFSGEKQQQDVLLQWRTANEIDLSRFEVQRSDNGTDFRTIGTVSPGSSRYTFADPNVFVSKSVVFYRLKSVDLDGRFTYSAIIRLSKQLTGAITVFPNPVQDVMTVSGLRQGGVLRLVTADGRLLVQLPVQAQTVTLDMSRYAKGLYYLHYQQGGEMQTRPILRQ